MTCRARVGGEVSRSGIVRRGFAMASINLRPVTILLVSVAMGTVACAAQTVSTTGAPVSADVAGACSPNVDRPAASPSVADLLTDPGPSWVRATGIRTVDAPTNLGSAPALASDRAWASFTDPVVLRQGTAGPTAGQVRQPGLILKTVAEDLQHEAAGTEIYAALSSTGSSFGVSHLLSARPDGSFVAMTPCDNDQITQPLADFLHSSNSVSATARFDDILKDPRGDTADQLRRFVASTATVVPAATQPPGRDGPPDQRQLGPGADPALMATLTDFRVVVFIPSTWIAATDLITPDSPSLCVKTKVGFGSCTAVIPGAIHGASNLELVGYRRDDTNASLVIIHGSDPTRGFREIGSFDAAARPDNTVTLTVLGPPEGPDQLVVAP